MLGIGPRRPQRPVFARQIFGRHAVELVDRAQHLPRALLGALHQTADRRRRLRRQPFVDHLGERRRLRFEARFQGPVYLVGPGNHFLRTLAAAQIFEILVNFLAEHLGRIDRSIGIVCGRFAGRYCPSGGQQADPEHAERAGYIKMHRAGGRPLQHRIFRRKHAAVGKTDSRATLQQKAQLRDRGPFIVSKARLGNFEQIVDRDQVPDVLCGRKISQTDQAAIPFSVPPSGSDGQRMPYLQLKNKVKKMAWLI